MEQEVDTRPAHSTAYSQEVHVEEEVDAPVAEVEEVGHQAPQLRKYQKREVIPP